MIPQFCNIKVGYKGCILHGNVILMYFVGIKEGVWRRESAVTRMMMMCNVKILLCHIPIIVVDVSFHLALCIKNLASRQEKFSLYMH